MSENMRIWDAVNRPPSSALKTIKAGRIKGMTDVSPVWRLQALTEQFGPCGIGWVYEIEDLWTTPGGGEEIIAHAKIKLTVKIGGEWSAAIPGVGGKKQVAKESGGLYTNDEAFKMAVTDAIGVAFKALGGAADIYAGLWDGSKYADVEPQANTEALSGWLDEVGGLKTESLASVKAWWGTVKAQVKKDLGEATAARVYDAYQAILGPMLEADDES